MKKILAILVISLFTLSVHAQEKRTVDHSNAGTHSNKFRQQRHHQKMEMMNGIAFSEAQKAQMKANREAFKSKMKEINKQDNITVGEMKAKKLALNKERKEAMQNILTPEQKNQLARNKTELMAKKKEMNEKRLAEMQTTLGLSNDQIAKLKEQHEMNSIKIQAIKENESLTRDDKRQQMKTIRDLSKEQRKSILTADQLKKLEEMKKEKKENNTNQSKK